MIFALLLNDVVEMMELQPSKSRFQKRCLIVLVACSVGSILGLADGRVLY